MLKRKAQVIIEYALIFAALTAAAAAMGIYVRRSTNAKLERTAIGLNAVFSEMNAPGASGSGSGMRDYPLYPEPATYNPQTSPRDYLNAGLITEWLNNGDFARGVDLLGDALGALAAGDIAGAQALINEALALINQAPIGQIRGLESVLVSRDKGAEEIRGGLAAIQMGIDFANAALGFSRQAEEYLLQAEEYLGQAAEYSRQAANFLVWAANARTPEERAGFLIAAARASANAAAAYANAMRTLNNTITMLNNATAALNNAIAALNNGRDLINRGIELIYEGEDVNPP